jgi:CheY-like chemotaxis protein
VEPPAAPREPRRRNPSTCLRLSRRCGQPHVVEFLSDNLEADDFVVVIASTGSEAISMRMASRAAVVFLDIVLPDMSGHEVCRIVRDGDPVNDGWDADVPIITRLAPGQSRT